MPLLTERNEGHEERRQRNNKAWILPFQPCRAMRTNQPPPRIGIKEKRGGNVLVASGALRHGGYTLSLLPLLCRGSFTASMEPAAGAPKGLGAAVTLPPPDRHPPPT